MAVLPDVDELLAERGITLDHVTVYGGCTVEWHAGSLFAFDDLALTI